MLKNTKKMPITVTLLAFSYLIVVCGLGSLLIAFKFKDSGFLIYGFLILGGSLLLAALITMFAYIGQIVFDIRVDIQNSSRKANELSQQLNQDLKTQLQLQADTLNQNLLSIVQKFDQSSQRAKELSQKLTAIKDNFDQMNCDSKNMNQNINQIRTFFEQIEKHLDLKK